MSSSKKSIVLYKNKDNCCSCFSCLNLCPVNAISIKEDENGFKYPHINDDKCLKCGLCKKNCAYQKNVQLLNPLEEYVAVTKNIDILAKSSSGGVFGTIAKKFIESGGVVYGSSMENNDKGFIVQHIRASNLTTLTKILGSKYVKSDICNIFKTVEEDLKDGKKVLFSGTPCQIDALNNYLETKKTNKKTLYTIDIICHGTPNNKMFSDYIKYIENRKHCKIISFSFRDKEYNWGMIGSITYKKRGKILIKKLYSSMSSYYYFFLKGYIYQENCYSCKYACRERTGDLTIGDYWGIKEEHPDCLIENGGKINESKGVSCILVNSEKGKEIINNNKENFNLYCSEFEKISNKNKQLIKPVHLSEERNKILQNYRKYGYKGIEKLYRKKVGIKFYLYPLIYKIKQVKNHK